MPVRGSTVGNLGKLCGKLRTTNPPQSALHHFSGTVRPAAVEGCRRAARAKTRSKSLDTYSGRGPARHQTSSYTRNSIDTV